MAMLGTFGHWNTRTHCKTPWQVIRRRVVPKSDFLRSFESFGTPTDLTMQRKTPMAKNLGSTDRIMRIIGAIALAVCAFAAPLAPALRLSLFGGLSGYMMLTALAGSCLGYKLMGKSTCPIKNQA
jgi:hypothetical protein